VKRAEFEQRSLEHLDAMYRMAMQLTRRPDEAADLVQEAYLKALKAADRYQETGGGMRPWLFKILHNAFYTRVGQDKRRPKSVEDLSDARSGDAGPDEAAPAWDLASLDWEQVDDTIKKAIDALRPEYRTVLLLWGVEGLKYREIAAIEDVPIGTVMSRLHRARSLVMEHLREMAEEKPFRGG
jgi:RNA polymerase sigma-70 factor, ECF subfamily